MAVVNSWGGINLGEPIPAKLRAPQGSERETRYTTDGIDITLRKVFGVLMQATIGELVSSESGEDLSQRRFILMDAIQTDRAWPVTTGDLIVIDSSDAFEGGTFRIARIRAWNPWHIEVEVEIQP